MVIEDIVNKCEKIMSEIQKLSRTRFPYLKKFKKGKLFREVRKVNKLLKEIESKDVTKDNDLLYLGAALVTKVFEKIKQKVRINNLGGKEGWKFKLKSLIKTWGD